MKECLNCGNKKESAEFKGNSNRCNSCISEYQKEYRKSHKGKAKEYFKKYYTDNKEDILNRVKEYYSENIEKVSEYKRSYATDNKDKLYNYMHNYYIENKEELDAKNKKYDIENRKSLNIIRNKRNKDNSEVLNRKKRERRLNDPVYRISQNIRTYIRYCIKSKGLQKKTKTQTILGCSYDEFRLYLESKFEPWMNWDNYGKHNGEINYGWDIDHILPIASAVTEEDIIKLNHHSNLQPLCSHINRYVKKDKLCYD